MAHVKSIFSLKGMSLENEYIQSKMEIQQRKEGYKTRPFPNPKIEELNSFLQTENYNRFSEEINSPRNPYNPETIILFVTKEEKEKINPQIINSLSKNKLKIEEI